MRRLVELLTVFDWVTPAVGLVQDIVNDPTPLQSNSWTFFIPYDEALQRGWNARQIEKIILKKNGVKFWGAQITNGTYFFSVKLDNAAWTEGLLSMAGVPMQSRSRGAPRK